MLELQHPITSILGITFKDLFPGYFVLVFLTYVFQWSTISRLLSHRNLTGIVLFSRKYCPEYLGREALFDILISFSSFNIYTEVKEASVRWPTDLNLSPPQRLL